MIQVGINIISGKNEFSGLAFHAKEHVSVQNEFESLCELIYTSCSSIVIADENFNADLAELKFFRQRTDTVPFL